MESSLRVRVVNRSGLHARPCHAVVTTALGFESELRISLGPREVNGRSILELMTLEACQGSELVLQARGWDCVELLEALGSLFRSGFAEPDSTPDPPQAEGGGRRGSPG